VWVTGAFGGPLAALRQLEAGRTPAAWARERFAHPRARVREARWLRLQGATAAVDVSDSLVADLSHMAVASDVRIFLDLDRLPVLGSMDPRDAARSGEEYELAVTGPGTLDSGRFSTAFGVPLTRVGIVAGADASVGAAAGVDVLYQGERVALTGGHDHFTS
jgi:thiamine-monophosphate kinase